MADIEQHMLHFLENHDEQRIASPDFAGDAAWAVEIDCSLGVCRRKCDMMQTLNSHDFPSLDTPFLF